MVVWPEGALGYDPRVLHTDELQALAKETGVYVMLGYGFRTAAGLRNEAIVLTPEGEFLEPYGKDHPVVWLGETSISGGTYPAQETALGTVGTIICYDLNFTDTARKIAGNGAQLIAVPSNDWPALAVKQYSNLTLRAAENRVALVKADTQYDSAIIDPSGRIVSKGVSTEPGQRILVADVPLGRADAPLIHLGDWMGWLCIAATAAFMVMGFTMGRMARRPRPAESEAVELEKATERALFRDWVTLVPDPQHVQAHPGSGVHGGHAQVGGECEAPGAAVGEMQKEVGGEEAQREGGEAEEVPIVAGTEVGVPGDREEEHAARAYC
jgi:hypothetical protein